MGKFQFYHINEHYISYLHSIDTRVQYNKGQRRPYVGIVLSINGIDYYVPLATVYKGNIIKNLIMDCQSYTKYRPNETTGGIFVSWRRKEELPTGA